MGTGKLTSKLFKDAPQPLPSFPPDLKSFAPVPAPPPGPAKAPEVVYPERGHALERLVADLKAIRERSRQSVERLARWIRAGSSGGTSRWARWIWRSGGSSTSATRPITSSSCAP